MTITSLAVDVRQDSLFIGGSWRPAADGGRMDVVDPATGEVVASVASATVADVDAAVAAAQQARHGWAALSGRERGRILLRAAALMTERSEELAQAESLDVGKPITLARLVDVPGAIGEFEYYGTLAGHHDGAARRTGAPTFAFTRREPRGVVAAISPFNFPLILAASKIAPALAAGNAVVHKPAPQTPLSALLLADILAEAGVPDGVVNVIPGAGPELGDALVRHPGIDMVAFTGSTTVGRVVAATAGEHLKPVMVELGGNGANIVFADADLEKVVGTIVNSFVYNTGQFCMAGTRLLVERPVYDTLIDALAAAVAAVPVGRPADEGTAVGPLVSAAQRDRVAGMVEDAVAAGGRVVVGGARIDLDGGFYYAPTIIADLPNTAAAVQEEVFGPVLTVQAFDTEAEALELANSTAYGLAAGVQTSDISRAHRVSDALEAGIVWVNTWTALDPSMPFGGVKASGWGREDGPDALDGYTRTKSVTIGLD
ncbi:aldehyde dehydrogenase [Microbacterium sp. SORGH_AS_0888]|uniref:aldehyde dehydrogenase family protein n=1 Tax=Microbacterium sp. SORGH_AS_0888 TaxID=3041791 RepID=UPI00278918E7|nr:aldehyde dehydrogenase family protein [Microbacterium sp. SORGH_AS_0888]MDQ1129660.1 acyl-CoA reductase-like NAD-dependent aldehyde dehydrogenase [Microbacterium sp. SORGH_AS_0888]